MTQLFFKEFESQLWRLNSITKLEEINLSLSSHLHWKDGCWQTISLFSGRVWTVVQKHSGLVLPCTSLAHQTLLCQRVTTVLIFSGNLHPLWWSGGNRGGKSLQNKTTGGVSRMWCKGVMGNVVISLAGSMRQSCATLVMLEGSSTEHQTS